MADADVDAVVAGHICLDIVPKFGQLTGSSVGEILRPGKLLEVGAAHFSTGGPVSNTGLALRRLGVNVSLMGKCGEDPFGDILRNKLRQEAPSAEQGMVVAGGANTSYTIVLVPPGIDRIFLHCPGANDTFGADDVDIDLVGRARLFHFGYPPLMKRMYSDGGEELASLFQRVREQGTLTSLDMALPDPDSEAGRADWPQILERTLPAVDIFLPSAEEILYMLRRDRFDKLQDSEGGALDGLTAEDLAGVAGDCIRMGAGLVVIKCGDLGAYLQTADDPGLAGFVPDADIWRGVSMFEPTCRVDDIMSTVGSGDSSIAGFLTAFLQDESPERCMQFLTVVGAQNLSAMGAVGGIRSWAESVEQVNARPPKNPVPERLRPLVP